MKIIIQYCKITNNKEKLNFMKYFLLLSLLLSNLCVSAQQSGSVTPKQNFPKAGNENNYVYIPPKGLLIPESAKVQVIYINKRYVIKKILLKKDNENYEFSLKYQL